VFDPRKIIETLNRHRVDYVVIGGFAATLHGCPEQTYDLDIFYADQPDNRRRLLEALREIGAQWDVPLTDAILQRQPVFALNSKLGDLDIFNRVLGLESFEEALAHRQVLKAGECEVPILDLPALIKTKQAAADPNPRKQSALEYLRFLEQRSRSRQS
jgi:hypothetical protein